MNLTTTAAAAHTHTHAYKHILYSIPMGTRTYRANKRMISEKIPMLYKRTKKKFTHTEKPQPKTKAHITQKPGQSNRREMQWNEMMTRTQQIE